MVTWVEMGGWGLTSQQWRKLACFDLAFPPKSWTMRLFWLGVGFSDAARTQSEREGESLAQCETRQVPVKLSQTCSGWCCR